MLRIRNAGIFLFLVLGLWLIPGMTVHADRGPKPSIEVELINPPQEYYYVDLLEIYGNDPKFEEKTEIIKLLETEQSEADLQIKKRMIAYEQDHWRPRLDRGNVDRIFHPKEEDQRYAFDYSVPSTFRVIVVTESGQIYVSNEITKTYFNAVCTYDVQSGILEENLKDGMTATIVQMVICYLITLVIEGLMLLPFGLAVRKNWLPFFLVNMLTQFVLQAALHREEMLYGSGLRFLATLFLLEFGIGIFEACCYAKTLTAKDGNKYTGKNIGYAVAANLCSFIPGRVIPFL